MKKKSKTPKIDPLLEGMMSKLLDRLVSLEKKVDRILAQGAGSKNVQVPAAPRHERTLYEAICADCSKVCEVPFRPTEERPVYCKSCWAVRKAGRKDSRPGMPVLTPVSLPPKPASKLSATAQAALVVNTAKARAKKASAKSAKKKRSR